MLRFLANIPIKRKVIWVILLTSTAGLVAATLSLFLYQLVTFRRSFVRDIDVLSEILANQSQVAVAFKFTEDVEEILNVLKGNRTILSAVMFHQDGTEVGRFGVETNLSRLRAVPSGSYQSDGEHLLHAHPITYKDKADLIGTLYLRTEYQKAFDDIVRAHVGVLAAVFVVSILLTLALSTRLQRVISDPILRLADTAKTVAEKKDYSVRVYQVGSDELGVFTGAFNQMLTQIQAQDAALQQAHDQLEERVQALQREIAERQRAEQELERVHSELLEASRQAGMAEVATGVLHNVGNVLNSVNVSSTLLHDQIRKSEVATVGRLAELLRQHERDLPNFLTQDPKGRLVPQFLGTLAEHLTAERATLLKELDLLAKNVEHIKDIVSMQQNYAKVSGFVENVNVEELVEHALQFNAAALERHGVELERRFEPVPRILVDKHKVLQILVNLVHNAKYALQESGRLDKRVTVGIRSKDERSVEILVEDNGVGIPPENLTRIFAHGFTTRRHGHGFGLHRSALAAQEMGGELRARSVGPGQGATFVLELPLSTREVHHDTDRGTE